MADITDDARADEADVSERIERYADELQAAGGGRPEGTQGTGAWTEDRSA